MYLCVLVESSVIEQNLYLYVFMCIYVYLFICIDHLHICIYVYWWNLVLLNQIGSRENGRFFSKIETLALRFQLGKVCY